MGPLNVAAIEQLVAEVARTFAERLKQIACEAFDELEEEKRRLATQARSLDERKELLDKEWAALTSEKNRLQASSAEQQPAFLSPARIVGSPSLSAAPSPGFSRSVSLPVASPPRLPEPTVEEPDDLELGALSPLVPGDPGALAGASAELSAAALPSASAAGRVSGSGETMDLLGIDSGATLAWDLHVASEREQQLSEELLEDVQALQHLMTDLVQTISQIGTEAVQAGEEAEACGALAGGDEDHRTASRPASESLLPHRFHGDETEQRLVDMEAHFPFPDLSEALPELGGERQVFEVWFQRIVGSGHLLVDQRDHFRRLVEVHHSQQARSESQSSLPLMTLSQSLDGLNSF